MNAKSSEPFEIKSFLERCIHDGNESPQIDYKHGYTRTPTTVAAQIAKHICGMANFETIDFEGRGFLILGANGDTHEIVGGMDEYIATDQSRANLENTIKSFLRPKPRIDIRAYLDSSKGWWGVVILNPVYSHNLPYSMAKNAPWRKDDPEIGDKYFHESEIFIRDGQSTKRITVPDELDDLYERKRHGRLPKPILVSEYGQPIRGVTIRRPYFFADYRGRTEPYTTSEFQKRGFAADKSAPLTDPEQFQPRFNWIVSCINYLIWCKWFLANDGPRSAREILIDFHIRRVLQYRGSPFFFLRTANPWESIRNPSMRENEVSIINEILHKGFQFPNLSPNRVEPLIEFGFLTNVSGREPREVSVAYEINASDGFLGSGRFPIRLEFTEERGIDELDLSNINYATYSEILFE